MQDTYTIADREFELKPLKGRKARAAMPRILELAAAALNLASVNGVDLTKVFPAEGEEVVLPSFGALTQTAVALSQYFREEYTEIEQEVFPILLSAEGKDWVYIDEEAGPYAMYAALWVAIQYHMKTSFGIEVQQALKNLQEQAEVEEEPEAESSEK